MKVYLVNDTSGYHFGCDMVVKTIREQVEQRGCQWLGSVGRGERLKDHAVLMERADLVIVNGEGTLHHGRKPELFDLADRYNAALINATIDEYALPDTARKFQYVAVRESLSAEYWEDYFGYMPPVVPDLSLMQSVPQIPSIRDIGLFDSVVNKDWDNGWRTPHDPDFVVKAQKYRRWVTGRFHGACLAIICGRAFSAYRSNTRKIEGLMMDAGLASDYYKTREEALDNLPDNPRENAQEYLDSARRKIPLMFDEMLDVA